LVGIKERDSNFLLQVLPSLFVLKPYPKQQGKKNTGIPNMSTPTGWLKSKESWSVVYDTYKDIGIAYFKLGEGTASWYCAYIKIPKDSRFHGRSIEELETDYPGLRGAAWGGITYSYAAKEPSEDWVVGFDTSHGIAIERTFTDKDIVEKLHTFVDAFLNASRQD
jgi:hypothetical protein